MIVFRASSKIRLLTPLLIVLLMGLAACKHGEKSHSTEVPADLEIMCGQEGTFAGRSAGYTITAAGEVLQWEGKYPQEVRKHSAAVDREHVRKLWKHAVEIGFLNMKDQEMATVNFFISVSADGESRRVTWSNRDENAPTPAQEFFDECMKTARGALGESTL